MVKFIKIKAVGIQCFAVLSLMLFSTSLFADTALVIRGTSSNFEDIVRGMKDDLEDELEIDELVIEKGASTDLIAAQFKKIDPKIVILMGNKAVNLYAKYQAKNKTKEFPPSIAVAALFIDRFVSKLNNATAIRYEIPVVTSAVSMRTIVTKPVKKIGVVYRKWMAQVIQENRGYVESEGMELVGIELPNKSKDMALEVKNALKKLESEVDVIWILNDNKLLSGAVIGKAWLPERKKSKIPAIVGIKLFMTKFPLGSFAIVPDDYNLGVQTASMIFEILENDWQLETTDVQQPVSVKKFANAGMMKQKKISYKRDKLNQMDEVIE